MTTYLKEEHEKVAEVLVTSPGGLILEVSCKSDEEISS